MSLPSKIRELKGKIVIHAEEESWSEMCMHGAEKNCTRQKRDRLAGWLEAPQVRRLCVLRQLESQNLSRWQVVLKAMAAAEANQALRLLAAQNPRVHVLIGHDNGSCMAQLLHGI